MDISEEDWKLLHQRVLRKKVDDLMQEPYDEDMEVDDFWSVPPSVDDFL